MTEADLADLISRHPANPIPRPPYVALFGNHHNNWRDWVKDLLVRDGVPPDRVYDSTDRGWREVDDDNGDRLQPWINELVRRQHAAMREACCLVFSMDARERTWVSLSPDETASVPSAMTDYEGRIFAARCELGWLAGTGITAYVWVPGDLEGRNYLRAVIGLYESLHAVADLGDAARKAAADWARNQ